MINLELTALIRKTAFFFGLPFGVAGRIIRLVRATHCADRLVSLADEEEQIESSWGVEDWGAVGLDWNGRAATRSFSMHMWWRYSCFCVDRQR